VSKRYKNKVCVYCGETSTQPDHIFAREFFLEADRDNLPKVPACRDCNSAKSALEHYATSVLPFGGKHATAEENLRSLVPARLNRNRKLSRDLIARQGRAWRQVENGLLVSHTTLPVEYQSLLDLHEFVGMGLLWHHWRTLLTSADGVKAVYLDEALENFFDAHFFRVPVRDRVDVDLGNGTARYEGVQGVDCEQLSVWRVRMMGGVELADSSGARRISAVGVITGPRAALKAIGAGSSNDIQTDVALPRC